MLKETAWSMFLMEETIAPDGGARILIYMRPDGLFEGHLYRSVGKGNGNAAQLLNLRWSERFEVCALTETLPRARVLAHEELGCSAETCETCRMP